MTLTEATQARLGILIL